MYVKVGFIKQLKNEFKGYNPKRFSKDLMAGLTVAAVALPLALAFGVSSGADAAAGLITAIIAGFVISALSGASYQISGPTGAMTAVIISIIAKYKLQGVFIVCVLAGIILLLTGIFKLGKLISLIPLPVVTGFTSGIAIIIVLGQIDNLFGTRSVGESAIQKLISYGDLGFAPNVWAVLISLLVIAIMIIYPKKWDSKIPSSLVGIIVATIISVVFNLNVAVVGEIPQTLLPEVRLTFSEINFADMTGYISPAFTIAALAMIESLLCGASASRMKDEPFDANQELIAQGVGNIIIPFFGGVPATAAIARTSVAIKSGGQTRLTGIIHSLILLASMFLLAPVMSKLPLSALAGVLVMTAWRMNEWDTIKYIFKNKFKTAIAQFIITMICTVVFDLAVAIVIGVVLSFILFIIKSTKLEVVFSKVENEKLKQSDVEIEAKHPNSVVIYITGTIFFANVDALTERVTDIYDYDEVIISMRGVSGIDFGGARRFVDIIEGFKEDGRRVIICGANKSVKQELERVGVNEIIGENGFYFSVDKALLSE